MSRIPTDNAIRKAQEKCLELLIEFDGICKKNNLTYWLDGGTLLGSKRHNGFIPWDDDVDLCLPISDYFKALEILSNHVKDRPDRLLYFNGSNFKSWIDYYGDCSLLSDALFPVRIDLLPVKYLINSDYDIKIDRSLTEIATLYMRGFMKNSNAVIDEHKFWLPSSNEDLKIQKERFLNFYFEHCLQTSQEARQHPDFLVSYIFNDAYVKRSRPYFNSDWIFPITHRENFEQKSIPQPNDIDAYLTLLYGERHMEIPSENNRISHLKFLEYNTTFSKINILKFIGEIYNLRFRCYHLTGSKSSKYKKILNYIRYTLSLIARGQWKTAFRFWRFNFLHSGEV